MTYLVIAVVMVVLVASILYLYSELRAASLKSKESEIKNDVDKASLQSLVDSNNSDKDKSK